MQSENDVDGYNYRTKRVCFRKQLKLKALAGLQTIGALFGKIFDFMVHVTRSFTTKLKIDCFY